MSIKIDPKLCLACGICDERCILDNIRVRMPPCRAACPIHVNCQAYATLISMERYKEALEMVHEDLVFPGVLGYVCHHPCEAICTRREVDSPVAIKDLKRFLVDYVQGIQPDLTIEGQREEKVAVVGGGPAGLQCAIDLRRMGYRLTLYEGEDRLGGMMWMGIPTFHLPREILDRDLQIVDKIGINVQLGAKVGKTITFDSLRKGYQAIFLAVGVQVSEGLGMVEEGVSGIHSGLDLLKDIHLGKKVRIQERVLIIGGGNVAVDAARASRRLGALDVRIACLEQRDQMMAFEREIEAALEEEITLNCSWGPKRILTEGSRLTGIEFKRCLSVWDATGRFNPVFNEHETFQISADTAIVAIGQAADLSFLGDEEGFGLFSRGTLPVNPLTLETSLKGVFAGGDMVTGPKSVLDAMAAGKKAAISIDRFLRGQDLSLLRDKEGPFEQKIKVDLSQRDRIPRMPNPKLDVEKRIKNFDLVELGFNEETARMEGARCLRCGYAYEHYHECWYCLPCEIECPTGALKLEIPFLVR